jgi:hypothetical protein
MAQWRSSVAVAGSQGSSNISVVCALATLILPFAQHRREERRRYRQPIYLHDRPRTSFPQFCNGSERGVSFGGRHGRDHQARPAKMGKTAPVRVAVLGRCSSELVWTPPSEAVTWLDQFHGEAQSSYNRKGGPTGMFHFLRLSLCLILSVVVVSGCGLLPTDRPPSGGRFSVNYSPDPTQPTWHRLLYGTRWIGEGPPQ